VGAIILSGGDNAALFNAAEVCQDNVAEWFELLDKVEGYLCSALFHLLNTCEVTPRCISMQ
jgi:hypothetical protein